MNVHQFWGFALGERLLVVVACGLALHHPAAIPGVAAWSIVAAGALAWGWWQAAREQRRTRGLTIEGGDLPVDMSPAAFVAAWEEKRARERDELVALLRARFGEQSTAIFLETLRGAGWELERPVIVARPFE